MEIKQSQKNKILSCNNLGKIFSEGDYSVKIFSNINFDLGVGERVAIVGASGSGKSTLLHLLGGLDEPTQGTVILQGKEIFKMCDLDRGQLRNATLGFVYQFHHLLAEFSALDNVAMPLMIRGISRSGAHAAAYDMLMRVGLTQRIRHVPGELSGGERQRVALARALVTKPACVLADEPTGNLDQGTAQQVFELMMELATSFETSFIIVTHDRSLATKCERTLLLSEGGLLANVD